MSKYPWLTKEQQHLEKRFAEMVKDLAGHPKRVWDRVEKEHIAGLKSANPKERLICETN